MNNEKHQIFVERMNEINPNIKIIGEYTKAIDHIEVECLICGKHWNPTPNKLLIGRGCPDCANRIRGSKIRKSHEDFVNDVKEINTNIIVLSHYVKSTVKVDLECSICHHKWSSFPYNILSGRGCPKCKNTSTGNRCRKSQELFVREIKEINPDIKIIGDYKGRTKEIEVKCLKCGRTWNVLPPVLLRGGSCSSCCSSYGEQKIEKYLIDHDYPFESQKTFDSLLGLGGRLLRYDFYLPDQNLLIEFQGRQHEMPVDFSGDDEKGAENRFDIQTEHDKRKRNYAQKNNINLLEIWHYDFDNIDTILDNRLRKEGSNARKNTQATGSHI